MKSKYLTIILLVLAALTLGACASEQTRLARAQQLFYLQDYNSAFKKLYPLARGGNAEAQYAMGYLYYYGKGVVENDTLAKQWFTLAAANGQVKANKALKMLRQPRGKTRARI